MVATRRQFSADRSVNEPFEQPQASELGVVADAGKL